MKTIPLPKDTYFQDKYRQSNNRIAFESKSVNFKFFKYLLKKLNKIENWNFCISNFHGKYYIDFYNNYGGKLHQLIYLIKLNNYDPKDIFYFGDSGPDLLCAKFVRKFYLVCNNKKILKENHHINSINKVISIKFSRLIEAVSAI
jgi:hypothetical protein